MSTHLQNLNESQLQAVINTEGPSLVIAGAGSGKTRVLTNRIAHLLKNGVPASSILALTFTNKAAREMKERIAKEVGTNVARHLWMGTFHSIFSRILRAEATVIDYPSTFTIYDSQDSKSLLKTIIKSCNLDENSYKPNVILSRISNAKNNLVTAATYAQNTQLKEADAAARIPKTAEIYAEYSRRCKNVGAMDFDDLLLITNVLFKNHKEILNKYQNIFKYILVDEYQDTNFSQYLIVKRLAENHLNLCVVGDDAQSIYSFRGARIENILNFQNDYPNYKTYKLEQNYRSTQTIVNAANSLIAKNKHQLQKNVFSQNSEGNRIKVLNSLSDQEEGFLVVNEIYEMRVREDDKWSDFAILYRTNAQSRVFEEVLRKRNIPYKIYGGLSFYQRKEIKDILGYFRLIINSKDDESFKRILNFPARGIGDTTMSKIEVMAAQNSCSMWGVSCDIKLLKEAGLNNGAINKVSEFVQLITKFADQIFTAQAFEIATQIASQSGILAELYKDKSPENISRYENTQELLNAIQQFSLNAIEEDKPNLLPNFMEEVSLLTDQDEDKDADKNKVTLMTVHSSKGLEFKNVFVVGLEENLFPSGFSGTITLSELEEERRLFYVAITRAEKNAILSFAQQRYKWGKLEFCNPSRFIGEIDMQFLDIQNSRLFPNFRNQEIESNENRSRSQPPQTSKFQPRISPVSPVNQRITTQKSNPIINNPNFIADDPNKIEVGIMVEHQRFGRGKVTGTEGEMPEKKVTVFFPSDGERTLLLKFAKLKIVK